MLYFMKTLHISVAFCLTKQIPRVPYLLFLVWGQKMNREPWGKKEAELCVPVNLWPTVLHPGFAHMALSVTD